MSIKNLCASVFLFGLALTLASASPDERLVNLNEPGALEALRRENPTEYRTIRKILDAVQEQPESPNVPQLLQTTYKAHDVSYLPVLLTSDPPKKNLAFTLGKTRYQIRVTLTHF